MDKCIVPGCQATGVKTGPALCYNHWRILPTRYKEDFIYATQTAAQRKRLTRAALRVIKIIETNHGLENYPYYPKP